MLKISLYQNFCVEKCVICISTYDYDKNKSYTTDRPTTCATGRRLSARQEPRIPYALSRSLLKSTGLTSEQVGLQTEMTHISVNSWVTRFETEGIKGLETRTGRERKLIMDNSDEEAVRIAIENDRQSVKKAKESWQQTSGKEVSESTFRVFLSALARDIDV